MLCLKVSHAYRKSADSAIFLASTDKVSVLSTSRLQIIAISSVHFRLDLLKFSLLSGSNLNQSTVFSLIEFQ